MRRRTALWTGGLGVLALAITYPVYAHCGKCAASAKEIVSAMDAGKVSLAAAISAAETHSKGKAVAAHGEAAKGNLAIAVYCLAGDKLMEVTVDKTGKATGSKEVKAIGEHAGHDAGKTEKKP